MHNEMRRNPIDEIIEHEGNEWRNKPSETYKNRRLKVKIDFSFTFECSTHDSVGKEEKQKRRIKIEISVVNSMAEMDESNESAISKQ